MHFKTLPFSFLFPLKKSSMASQQDLLNQIAKLKEELTCTICTGVIDDPHVLVCGHTFCGVCILQWLPTKKICPVCRVAVMRQPVHVNMIQKLSDFFRALDNTKSIERLTRAHWQDLFPTETQSTFIRDIDQDGIIHRCSQCGWELDEDNFCENCQISFDGEINQTIRDDSDHASHFEQDEEDLSGFVVNDDESIVYSDSDTGSIRPPVTINLEESDEESMFATRRSRQNRIIDLSDDDSIQSESMADIPNSEDDESLHYHGPDFGLSEEDDDDDDDDEDEEEYRRQQKRSRYIDDFAESDEEEEEEMTSLPRHETPVDSITRAISQMKSNHITQAPVSIDSSTDTSSDESDAPDYENMTAPLSNSQTISKPTTSTETPKALSEPKGQSSSQKKRKHKQKKNKQKKK
ncbi:hypothetical protein EDC96DRAFT_568593 [Choanephora cucurbitarum]|nr:hypothetical protein EDC96DRAFT_568593 [Choanephora cucurbitarum]